MADVQCENGFTKIANELLEALLIYKFPKNTSDIPFKLIMFVIRKTYGFNKIVDKISLTQFETGIKIDRKQICYWLNYLVEAKILVKQYNINKSSVLYSINKDYDKWLSVVEAKKLVEARSFTSGSHHTETSGSQETHKRKKEILQKKDNYSVTTILICRELGIEPTDKLDEYICKYQHKELKPLVDNLIQWCLENKKDVTGLRFMNWLRKEFN
jgi:phage replication O-like protein O